MVYKYEKRIANQKNIDNFYSKDNFVGYILPNGDVYQTLVHNVSNIDTVLTMYLDLLERSFNKKEEILNVNTSDPILKIVINYLKNIYYDEVIALKKFIRANNLFIRDLIVQLFGCHLVTRLNKTIITSKIDHSPFFNYLLNDFHITTIDKIVYDDEKKEYVFHHGIERNEYLYDEINGIKNNIRDNEVELFYKGK